MHDSGIRTLPDWGKTGTTQPFHPPRRYVSQLARSLLCSVAMLARHRRCLALAALLHACARTHEPPTDDGSPIGGAAALAEPPAPAAPVAASMIALPSEVRSAPRADADDDPAEIVVVTDDKGADVVRFVAHAEVRLEPRMDAPVLGVIGFGERVRMVDEVEGEGCERPWVQVEPGGFVCAKHEPVAGTPSRVMLPRLSKGGLVPGVYGKLREGQAQIFPTLDAAARGLGGSLPSAALTVRRQDVASVGGRSFWKTRHGYVAAKDLRKLEGSRFRGVALGSDGLVQPLAWARFRGDDGRIAVRSAPSPRAKVVSRMRAREHARVEQTSDNGAFVRLVGLGWVARDEVRIAAATAPPSGLLGTSERWIDIDIDEQVLVAYEGTRPVYATLVSTGRRTHDTPIGVFRIERKVAERTMSSKPGDEEPYSVDRVPWTAYFTGSFALHAAYWHGSFGERKSHGCVNLAPADARVLYRFTTPAIVAAWSEVHGSAAQPGSIVRVRDERHPTPPLYGYALELANALPTRMAQADDAHAFANILGAG